MTGQPTYIELGVPDADRARTFYRELLGWQPSGTGGPGNIETTSLNVGLHSDDPVSTPRIRSRTPAGSDIGLPRASDDGGRPPRGDIW